MAATVKKSFEYVYYFYFMQLTYYDLPSQTFRL